MIYILYGEDDFSMKEALDRIKADSAQDSLGEADITTFEGSKLTYDELINACNTMSFLSPRRLVIVEGLLSRFEQSGKRGGGKAKPRQQNEWESLKNVTMPDSTVLIFLDGKLSKNNPLLKGLAKTAEVREFKSLSMKSGAPELSDWIRSRVRANAGEISPRSVQLLIDLIGNNLWVLSNEINKLCLYTGGRRIEESDINAVVSHAREANVFHLVDAIVQRRHGNAARILHQLLNEGAAPPYLLFMITQEFRLLIQVRELAAQRLGASEIGSRIGEYKTWKMEKLLKQTGNYSESILSNTYRRLLEADLSIKSGIMEGEEALDLLVADLCKR
ncbi:MAG: DNA polymerase III subunit delta [Dehalococcoidia bacterium]